MGYADGVALQALCVEERRRDDIPDTLLLLEHPPVITLGRSADAKNLLADAAELERRGIEIHEAGRGGDVTYHGPGQLVGYAIVALTEDERDAHAYLRRVEEALIRAVAEFGIVASRIDGLTGVWVCDEKLGAIGVRLSSGWITSHGFALNVGADLSGFTAIVPCGIDDHGVTSVARLLGREPDLIEVAAATARGLAQVLGRRLAWDGDGTVS